MNGSEFSTFRCTGRNDRKMYTHFIVRSSIRKITRWMPYFPLWSRRRRREKVVSSIRCTVSRGLALCWWHTWWRSTVGLWVSVSSSSISRRRGLRWETITLRRCRSFRRGWWLRLSYQALGIRLKMRRISSLPILFTIRKEVRSKCLPRLTKSTRRRKLPGMRNWCKGKTTFLRHWLENWRKNSLPSN